MLAVVVKKIGSIVKMTRIQFALMVFAYVAMELVKER
jgi:hypothetical protein